MKNTFEKKLNEIQAKIDALPDNPNHEHRLQGKLMRLLNARYEWEIASRAGGFTPVQHADGVWVCNKKEQKTV